MAQITIYVEDDVLMQLQSAIKSSGTSQSRWIADAIRLRMKKEWPASVSRLAGAWNDFPTAEEIRAAQGQDVKKEPL